MLICKRLKCNRCCMYLSYFADSLLCPALFQNLVTSFISSHIFVIISHLLSVLQHSFQICVVLCLFCIYCCMTYKIRWHSMRIAHLMQGCKYCSNTAAQY